MIFINVSVLADHSLQIPSDDFSTTIQVLQYPPIQLPFGQNITIICKTNLSATFMWWTVNDRNVTKNDR